MDVYTVINRQGGSMNYLNNGDVDGYWDLAMYISLLPQ